MKSSSLKMSLKVSLEVLDHDIHCDKRDCIENEPVTCTTSSDPSGPSPDETSYNASARRRKRVHTLTNQISPSSILSHQQPSNALRTAKRRYNVDDRQALQFSAASPDSHAKIHFKSALVDPHTPSPFHQSVFHSRNSTPVNHQGNNSKALTRKPISQLKSFCNAKFLPSSTVYNVRCRSTASDRVALDFVPYISSEAHSTDSKNHRRGISFCDLLLPF